MNTDTDSHSSIIPPGPFAVSLEHDVNSALRSNKLVSPIIDLPHAAAPGADSAGDSTLPRRASIIKEKFPPLPFIAPPKFSPPSCTKGSVSGAITLELCCGSAGLTASIRKRNFDALGVVFTFMEG